MGLKQISSLVAGPGALFLLIAFFMPWVTVSCSGSKLFSFTGLELAQGKSDEELSQEMLLSNPLMAGMGDLNSMFEGMDLEDFEGSDFEMSEDSSDFSFESSPSTEASPEDGEAFNKVFVDGDMKLFWLPFVGILALILAGAGFAQAGFVNAYTSLLIYIAPSLIGLALLGWKYTEIRDALAIDDPQAAAVMKTTYEAGWWISVLGLIGIFSAGVMGFLAVDPKPASAPRVSPYAPPLSDEAAAPFRQPAAGSAKVAPPTLTAEQMKRGFEVAKAHIQAKRYPEARAILSKIDHPTALQWLKKLDELDPQ